MRNTNRSQDAFNAHVWAACMALYYLDMPLTPRRVAKRVGKCEPIAARNSMIFLSKEGLLVRSPEGHFRINPQVIAWRAQAERENGILKCPTTHATGYIPPGACEINDEFL